MTSVTHYSIDTSGLIDGIERFYPIENFPALWDQVDMLIDEGRFHVSEEAWIEACSVASVLKEWCTDPSGDRQRCVVPTDDTIGAVAGHIVFDYPHWAAKGAKNSADPFVVAVAEVHAYKVISGETNGGPSKPKIPYVCGQRGIQHGRFVDLIVSEGWVF